MYTLTKGKVLHVASIGITIAQVTESIVESENQMLLLSSLSVSLCGPVRMLWRRSTMNGFLSPVASE